MKILHFGATGKTGQDVVERVLAQGHHLTAFVRRPNAFAKQHANLSIHQGDVLDAEAIDAAMAGHDAVICTLGMPLMNKDRLRERGTRNIVRAMARHGVKRLVCLSSLGTGDSFDMLPFHYRRLIVPLVLRNVVDDHDHQEALIKDSALDWVIVRPGNLTDAPARHTVRHGDTPPQVPLNLKISRQDVAAFMVDQLQDDTYVRRTPYLSY